MTLNPDYANIYDICNLTGRSFDTVLAASKRLGLRPPFNFESANILCRELVGSGLWSLMQIKIDQAYNAITANNCPPEANHVLLPKLASGDSVCTLYQWLVGESWQVREGQPIAKVLRRDLDTLEVVKSPWSGTIKFVARPLETLKFGQTLATIEQTSNSASAPVDPPVAVVNNDTSSIQLSSLPNVACEIKTTSQALRHGSINTRAGELPRFCPSLAPEPVGFGPHDTYAEDLKYALLHCRDACQSFFNDLDIFNLLGINDDVVSLPCFDESLYCALVREMHRYSLAEIAENKKDLASKNAGLGAMVGSLLGLISGNPFAPFLGHSYGKNLSDRGSRIEEFLPDPNLLFYQDENSFLSWSKAQVTSPRLRRLIFDRRVKADGNVFFRLIPAIVTADSVFPIQLFKIDSSTYFYRPFSAGIARNQPHYDSVKIQRRYFHLRGEGVVSETDMKVCISGRDVEEHESKIFRFEGYSLDYFYLDFKTSPGSVF